MQRGTELDAGRLPVPHGAFTALTLEAPRVPRRRKLGLTLGMTLDDNSYRAANVAAHNEATRG